ncbi:hypothetical protein Cantr_10752 [Candida viswanathii]|uniref:Uncharacterized protein n=1 Tax=Candida viswanathii TaxID=5486 RepID=A0A367YG13_9ASCO|nr:hypothetical protein Cantr_10752 [Candida viswanathii]
MYTDNFFDDPYTSQLEGNDLPELSVASSINNLYNVQETTYGSGTFNLTNDNIVPAVNGNGNVNGNINGNDSNGNVNNINLNNTNSFNNDVYSNNNAANSAAALGLTNPFATGSMPNFYDVQDIINESPFDYFMPNNLQTTNNTNTNRYQEKEKEI